MNNEFQAAAPVQQTAKKGSGATIAAAAFGLIAVVLGVCLAIVLINNNNKPTASGSSNDASNGSSTVVINGETVVVDVRKNDEAVRNLVNEIIDSFGSSYGMNKTYSEEGLPVKVADDLWASTNMSYGASISTYDGGATTNALHDKAVKVLTDKHSMSVVSTIFSGMQSNEEYSYDNIYYKNSDGLYCYISAVYTDMFYFSCADESWVTEEDKALDKALADAYNATSEGQQYKTKYMNAHSKDIKKNVAGTYETIEASFIDSAALFYRAVGGEWKFFKATQSWITCDSYDTAELKEAFKGTKCWDAQTNKETTLY